MTKHALGLDLLVVIVFAALGRASHDLELGVMGVLATAWPFVFGTAVGWLCLLRLPQGVRRWWLDGVVVAFCAIVLGMVLRWLTGEGTATAFVLVATGVLLGGLLGWRAVETLVIRPRAVTAQPARTTRSARTTR
ncbi:DUF3054 domain-containing protein [Ornithinimicrobium sufpigmenti]|uniref:DUF3054 domain-containing protein n=1 Tax=Ornithinimicrobium sufpigmenti TaxID=2508882 RepID=UPI001EDE8CEE|nr:MULTISPECIES: DUF3054 domain-containing protein [unclassified Ornithinimicrobium]